PARLQLARLPPTRLLRPAVLRQVEPGDDLGEPGVDILIVRAAPAGVLAHEVTRSTNRAVSAMSRTASWSRVATCPDCGSTSSVTSSLPTRSRNRSAEMGGT